MELVVLDTDVASYLHKHDTRAGGYVDLVNDRVTAISFMTVAELRFWAKSRNWGASRSRALETFIQTFVILPCDDAISTQWAEVMDGARRRGRRIQTADAWIAATALVYGLPLVTNNAGDFAGVEGLRIPTESP